jgi:hypothetical protein
MSQAIKASDIYTKTKPYVEWEITRLAWLEKPLFWLDVNNLTDRVETTALRLRDRLFASIGDIPRDEFDAVDFAYNVPFWTQGILEGTSMKPVVDIPTQTLYPYDPSQVVPVTRNALIDNVLSTIPERLLWRYFVQNLPELWKSFSVWWEYHQSSLWKRNLVVASNHITRMNLGIIAFCLHHFCGVSKENLYIVVWPKVMTHDFTRATVWQANVIKTFPNGPNGNIEYSGLNKLRLRAVNTMKGIMQDASSGTRVMIVAPSGGTDERMKDGSYSMKSPSPAFQNILDNMIGERVHLALIGMDDSGIFPGNKRLKRWKVWVGFSSIWRDPSLENLPQHIVDADGMRVSATWKEDR